jgi:hypothetical protein
MRGIPERTAAAHRQNADNPYPNLSKQSAGDIALVILLNVKTVATHQALFDSASNAPDEFRDITRLYLQSRLGSSISEKKASRHDGELRGILAFLAGGIRPSTLSGTRAGWSRVVASVELGETINTSRRRNARYSTKCSVEREHSSTLCDYPQSIIRSRSSSGDY